VDDAYAAPPLPRTGDDDERGQRAESSEDGQISHHDSLPSMKLLVLTLCNRDTGWTHTRTAQSTGLAEISVKPTKQDVRAAQSGTHSMRAPSRRRFVSACDTPPVDGTSVAAWGGVGD
jgi:hypothetical protein